MTEQGYIVNPSAVGNPNETPIVQFSPALVALFNPCQEMSADGPCNGVNGFHADGCPKAEAAR